MSCISCGKSRLDGPCSCKFVVNRGDGSAPVHSGGCECDPFGDCFVCSGDCSGPCEACRKPKLGDFENGYVTELAEAWGLDWRERANANPLNMALFLRCRYSQPFTATFEGGMKRSIEQRGIRLEDVAMRESPLLKRIEAAVAKGREEYNARYVGPAELVETYPARGRRSGMSSEAQQWCTHMGPVPTPNRAERRRMAAQKRRRS